MAEYSAPIFRQTATFKKQDDLNVYLMQTLIAVIHAVINSQYSSSCPHNLLHKVYFGVEGNWTPDVQALVDPAVIKISWGDDSVSEIVGQT